MKKLLYTAFFLIGFASLSYNIYAITIPSVKHEFKTSDREINFDIERGQGEVILHFKSSVFNTFDEIIVERSGGDNGNFSTCKTIELSQVKTEGDYYRTADKYPFPAKVESYYRIRTIAKDGSQKTFPPVLLEALTR